MKKILVCAVWLTIGAAVATICLMVYHGIAAMNTFLISRGKDELIVTTFVGPVVAIFLYFTYKLDHEFYNHRVQWLAGKLFWTCLLWIFSPLIMNTVSLIFHGLDLHSTSDLFFGYRFIGLWLIPLIILIVHIYQVLYDDVERWCRHHLFRTHFSRD